MIEVDAQTDAFLATFFNTWLFCHLPDSVRQRVVAQLQLCTFAPGAMIHAPKELPIAVHCVVQGQVRILGPDTHRSPTLDVVGTGALLGWDSLVRRTAVGSVRAAISAAEPEQEVLTLALPADEFEAIALQHLLPVLAERVSLIELFDALGHYLERQPNRRINLKEAVQYIDRQQLAVAQVWQPPTGRAARRAQLPELSSDRIWLLSGGAPVNAPIGTAIERADQLIPTHPSPFPVRLIGIDRRFLTSTVRQTIAARPHSVDAQLDSAGTSPPPAAPLPNHPIRRSPTPDPSEDLIACFGMICDRLQVPYRPDSLRKWLKENPIDQFEAVDLCLRVGQAIGLEPEVVRFAPTAGGINRICTPALIRYRDILVVLHEVTPTTAVIGSPRTGLLRLDPAELGARLVPTTAADRIPVCWAIVLERQARSPVKRFGFRWFLPALKTHRGVLVQVLIASMFVQLLGVANPLLVQQIIDQVIINANIGAMAMFGGLMVLFAVLESVLTVVRTYLFASTTHRIDLRLGIEIIRHLLRLPLSFFEKRPVGELASRLSELENIRQVLTGTALTAIMDVVFSVFYIGVMFLYSTRLTLCVLLTVPIVVASTLLVAGIQQRLLRAKSDHSSKVQSYLVETLGGIFTVKAQHMESLVEATWRERYVQYLMSGFTTSTISTMFSSFSQLLNTMSSLLVLWMGAGLVLQGELTLGGLIAFRILTGYVTGPLLRLAGLWQRFQETSLSMELLADIMNSTTEEAPQNDVQMELPPIAGHVRYQEVSFGFKPGQLQLSNLDLEIPAGSFVGIVGQSGSGKSTMLKLLPRLYLPQSGTIAIDDYDISKVNLSSLRRQVGIVPQDAVLFEGTIHDNIALFSDRSAEEVIAAAKVAEAHDFIMQLPEGYSTPVGERGASLSGGQRQRIAIARVVAREPRLLIFDEATSALDYETERRVCENLMRRFHDRTCFFITHRLTSITAADWILFMQSGAIAEQGTHAELMARRQLYYCLYMQQAQG